MVSKVLYRLIKANIKGGAAEFAGMKLPDGPAASFPGSNARKRKSRAPVSKPSASETSAECHRSSAEFDSEHKGQDLRRRRTARESACSSAPGPSSLTGAEAVDQSVEDAGTGNSRSTLRRLRVRAGSRFADSSVGSMHLRRRTHVADLLAEALELSD